MDAATSPSSSIDGAGPGFLAREQATPGGNLPGAVWLA